MISVQLLKRIFSITNIISLFYFLAVAIVSYTLINEHSVGRLIFSLFPVLMIIAKLTPLPTLKKSATLSSLAIVVIGGLIDPLEVELIEESFLLLPLTYIILYPGSLWPIVTSVLLLASYLPELPQEEIDEFIEDAIELLVITGFASVMAFFQQKLKVQMLGYRKDSMTDYLTKLSNRKAFYHDMARIKLAGSESRRYHSAQLLIDLDGFKCINDNMGHNIGDLLLKEFALRLNNIKSDRIRVYRLGGDEFAVLVERQHDLKSEAEHVAQQVLDFSRVPYTLINREYHLTSSIGIALYQDASDLIDIWCRNADIAMYKAKDKGRHTCEWFDQELLKITIRNYQLEQELTHALSRDQFYLHYQPKVCTSENRIDGVEALIRWQHPELGFIPPGDFISIAENSQQIIAIGRWVLTRSCEQAKIWLDAGIPVTVSVNVSAVQLAHDDICTFTLQLLEQVGLPAQYLQLEITETAIMENPDYIIETFSELRVAGVKVAIDDFGVAYSSLNYLKKLPVDVLKIDKMFVDDCVTKPKDHMIVRTIVQLGHNLGMKVTAEGVENQDQLELLTLEGCDKYQGYYFSKPVDAEQITALLEEEKCKV